MLRARRMKRRFLFTILSLSGCLLSSCELFDIDSSFSKRSEDSSFRDSSIEKESASSDSTDDSLSSSTSYSEGSFSSSSDFSDEDDLGYSYMYFGTERYLGDNQSGDFVFDANGLNIVSMSSENVFFDAEEKEPTSAIRIGSNEDSGMLNIAFEESLEIQALYLMAFTDATSVNVNCVTSSCSRSYLVKENQSTPANDFDYESSKWASFPLNGKATSFVSISSSSGGTSDIFYLSKIVVITKDDQSSGENGSESSQNSSSSSESSFSQGSSALPEGMYRLPRIEVNGDSANIYQINELSGGAYSCTIAKTITKGNEYFEPEDVAAYYQAFDSFPVNYCYGTSSDNAKEEALGYGKNGRCYFQYRYGSYHSDDYTPPLGPWSRTGVPYYELDISTKTCNPSYNNGKRISRGTYRIVILPKESSTSYPNEGGYDSICFFTKDHYDTFVEYCNYYDGWGESFVGANGKANSRPSITTIPLI